MSFANILFSFSGRITRKTFWLSLLALAAVQIALSYAAQLRFGLPPGYATGPIDFTHPLMLASLGISLLALWPTLAIFAKRRHDRDKTTWLLLPALIIMLVPQLIMFANPDIMPKPPTIPGGAPIMPDDPTALMVLGAAGLLSVIILIWLIVTLGFLRGTPGPNRFGDDPLGGTGTGTGTGSTGDHARPAGHDWAD